ncbi:Arc family DNA-binding protein [Croceicoccus ponticola]|nr:Arc family DNA-binding protein [Croceicoccus ponticola]
MMETYAVSAGLNETRTDNELVQLKLRFREDLRVQLEEAARANNTSMNNEIVARLRASIDLDERLAGHSAFDLFVEMASQIKKAEALTGKSWTNDLKTYWVARRLSDDIWKQYEPTPPNFEEITALQVRLNELHQQHSVLEIFLKECGVLGPMNALSSLALGRRPYDRELLAQRDPSQWHYPDRPGEVLTEEDRSIMQEKLDEWIKTGEEAASLSAQMNELAKPGQEAKARGRALYQHLVRTDEE